MVEMFRMHMRILETLKVSMKESDEQLFSKRCNCHLLLSYICRLYIIYLCFRYDTDTKYMYQLVRFSSRLDSRLNCRLSRSSLSQYHAY
jgi:hypothetical protein